MLDPFHFCTGGLTIKLSNDSINQSVYSQDHPKITSADMELETTQNLNIYFYKYQTETAIFLATKH